ncbi:unnamed protein product [Urochloa decumbens]|uniref:Uncharacterized protein n=1 Tax=Urochloa decumbens TaxID=240449 RepID=A0ABC8Z902_9POAL
MESSSDKGDLSKPQILPIQRPGFGRNGAPIRLRTNHFKVSVDSRDVIFYHYNLILKYEDDKDDEHVVGKGVGRKVIDKLQEIYASDLANMDFFAYDGEKNLYTTGPLPNVKNVFTVVLVDASSSKTPGGDGSPEGGDTKRMKRLMQAKTFKVELSLVEKDPKVPLDAITKFISGQQSDDYQIGLQILDIILRQHSARQGCLIVRQSFFHNPSRIVNLGGGVVPCPGFHSSFQPTQSGLSLNLDVSTTMILQPGPVISFILSNQCINDHDTRRIDWDKANRALKNLRIKTTHTNSEFKIFGLSEKSCYEQTFPLKQRNGNGSDTMEVTVYDYYLKQWGIKLKDSVNFPCLNVGKPKRPTYLPIELCNLVSLQRYTKALTVLQRSSLVQNSRQNPSERKSALSAALKLSNYNSDGMLKKCGISIASEFTQVDGRVLVAPKLKAGSGRDIFVRNGKWNFNNNMFIQTSRVKRWVVVDFSSRCDVRDLVRRLIHCGNTKGMQIDREDAVIEENPRMRWEPAPKRVNDMFAQIKGRFPDHRPAFLLCVLHERKNCSIYGPWKRACLADFGIVTQCLGPPPKKINDQYLTNMLLKINAKLGGLNSLLQMEVNPAIPLVSRVPTMILGMDVSHGSSVRRVPFVAAVSSLGWPLISRYCARVCTQEPLLEMIDSLFKLEGKVDRGLIRELIEDFGNSLEKKQLPQQIIIFRDGVSEGQFTQVLNIELPQIIEACKFFYDSWSPKFTVIVAQKNHHTRFFRDGNNMANVDAGTVVDKGICHCRNYDFYMCAHAGMIGTTRPTHYHVLYDEISFTPDDLQALVHSLSYVYQRSTSAVSVVAPVYYAHLAAAQVRQFDRFDDFSETGSSASGGSAPVPVLPRLKECVRSSMFFC